MSEIRRCFFALICSKFASRFFDVIGKITNFKDHVSEGCLIKPKLSE